jgi:hypothetical protein
MIIYVFGNGNIKFHDFIKQYESVLNLCLEQENSSFLVGDFRGTDTLTMEVLKHATPNVFVYHIGEKPRYLPDAFKTKVKDWTLMGGFENDEQRDKEAIKKCTHFIAIDFNTDKNRKSGTLKNIELCESLGKIRLLPPAILPFSPK